MSHTVERLSNFLRRMMLAVIVQTAPKKACLMINDPSMHYSRARPFSILERKSGQKNLSTAKPGRNRAGISSTTLSTTLLGLPVLYYSMNLRPLYQYQVPYHGVAPNPLFDYTFIIIIYQFIIFTITGLLTLYDAKKRRRRVKHIIY